MYDRAALVRWDDLDKLCGMDSLCSVICSLCHNYVTPFFISSSLPLPLSLSLSLPQARSEIGEDGFLEGELRGKVGFVPSNMLEVITDPAELAQMETLLHSQNSLNGRGHMSVGGEGSVTKMRAIYDYDPAQDSPNSESGSEVELAFTEGDVLTVFGQPDEDGFFQVSLSLFLSLSLSLISQSAQMSSRFTYTCTLRSH